MRVDLCWLSDDVAPPTWAHGAVVTCAPTVVAVARAMAAQVGSSARATLFWSAALGRPSMDAAWFESRQAEVVHAGLSLGMQGQPSSIDFIAPTWMWNLDAPADIESTSWRISLDACLIRHDVISQLGGLRTEFQSLGAAALELGHRYLTRGAFVRHDPTLLAPRARAFEISAHDDLLFARLRYGTFWARWALGRGLIAKQYSASQIGEARRAIAVAGHPNGKFVRDEVLVAPSPTATVTVVLPTIERYPYLRQLLPQLAVQTHPVHEILIIDQTPIAWREVIDPKDYPTLPIRVVIQETPGQCTARNEALRLATGEFALFIDDDDEVEPDLVERHLRTLATYNVDVCCGVNEEVGAGPVPEYQRFLRATDIFPTNNTMIRRRVLKDSGMFDLAYDCKMCEDGDLGNRVHLSGALMILDSRISVLHHHAPRGGLRQHGARAVTYASSRKLITHRNLPHLSEVYLGMRYFTERQVHESLLLRAWGTLRLRGGLVQQGLKMAYGLAKMPDTMARIRKATSEARKLFATYPQIDPLPDA